MSLQRDADGYLIDRAQWTAEVAHCLAAEQNIELTPDVWALIQCIQAFFDEFDHSPSNRPLSRWIKQSLGPDMASTLYLRQHFPISPPKQLALIAGLPRPENCL